MDINYELYKVFYFCRYFSELFEASKQLYISQSAVSQSIKTLEKLGQPLFIHPAPKSRSHTRRKNSLKACRTGDESDPPRRKPASRFQYLGARAASHRASDAICRYFWFLFKAVPQNSRMFPIKGYQRHSLSCVDLLEQGKVDLIVTNFPNAKLTHSICEDGL